MADQKAEADMKAKAEADQKAKEEADNKAKEEADQQAQEDDRAAKRQKLYDQVGLAKSDGHQFLAGFLEFCNVEMDEERQSSTDPDDDPE